MKKILVLLLLIPVVNGFDFEEINSDYFNDTLISCDYDTQINNYLNDSGLVITLNIDLEGYHEFYAEIKGESGYVGKERDLIVRGNQVEFLFIESELFEQGITKGIFDVNMDNCSLDLNYPLPYHFSLIENCNTELKGNCLNYNLNVNLDGTYSFNGELYDLFDNRLDSIDETFNKREIDICFNGSDIFNKELNGPYVLKNILIKQEDKTYSGGSCTSESIAYYSFNETTFLNNNLKENNSSEKEETNNKIKNLLQK